jgi:hypothetical protein
MRLAISQSAAALLSLAVWGQARGQAPVEIAAEPHHTLVLQNAEVRVFRLKLQPEEATLTHRHNGFYAFLSLRPVALSNEVRGRQPVVTHMDAGELHTSKGGFVLAERNKSSEAADILIIEPVKSTGGFTTPMGGFGYHDAALGPIFEAPMARAYAMTIAAQGRTENHTENYDRLLIAVTDLKLRESVAGQPASVLEMKAGEIRWMPRGLTHATTNIGTSPATFITFEFD